MTPKEHQEQHIKLHAALDELLADYITHTGKRLRDTTIFELMDWSHMQTIKPSEIGS